MSFATGHGAFKKHLHTLCLNQGSSTRCRLLGQHVEFLFDTYLKSEALKLGRIKNFGPSSIPTEVLTLVKTCEPVADMRRCRSPRDWSLLALQNIRTGKSHYLVICRCPESSILEGPMSHDQPTYASVPGIRVYGMMCVNYATSAKRKGRPLRMSRSLRIAGPRPAFPWSKVDELMKTITFD